MSRLEHQYVYGIDGYHNHVNRRNCYKCNIQYKKGDIVYVRPNRHKSYHIKCWESLLH